MFRNSTFFSVGLAIYKSYLSIRRSKFGYIHPTAMHIIPYLVRTSLGIVSSITIILLLKKICSYSKIEFYTLHLAFIGSLTLGIYTSHDLFYTPVLWGWLIKSLPMNSYIIHCVWAIIAFLCSTCLVMLIKKNGLLSFLFLGISIKNNK